MYRIGEPLSDIWHVPEWQ